MTLCDREGGGLKMLKKCDIINEWPNKEFM